MTADVLTLCTMTALCRGPPRLRLSRRHESLQARGRRAGLVPARHEHGAHESVGRAYRSTSASPRGRPLRASRADIPGRLDTSLPLTQTFDSEALISLIMSLVKTDERFIPPPPYSCVTLAPRPRSPAPVLTTRLSNPLYRLYIRPTMIGTRPALGVGGLCIRQTRALA